MKIVIDLHAKVVQLPVLKEGVLITSWYLCSVSDAVSAKRFDVAFSLAGEQRNHVEPIAEELRRRGYSVFFYPWHEAELAKPNLDNHLRRIYRDDAKLLMPVLSADYARKPWTGEVELTVIRELIFEGRDDEIMALRTDDATVTGFSKLHGCVDMRSRSAVAIADLIERRLGQSERDTTVTAAIAQRPAAQRRNLF